MTHQADDEKTQVKSDVKGTEESWWNLGILVEEEQA